MTGEKQNVRKKHVSCCLVLNESDLDWPGLEPESPKREVRDSVLQTEREKLGVV